MPTYEEIKRKILSTTLPRTTSSSLKIIKAFKEDTILKASLPQIEVIKTEKGLLVKFKTDHQGRKVLTGEYLAKIVGMSRKQFFDTLKNVFGVSVKELIDAIVEYKKNQYRTRIIKKREWKSFEEFKEIPVIKYVIENHRDGEDIVKIVYDLCSIFEIQPEQLFETYYDEELGMEMYSGEEYSRKYIEFLKACGLRTTTIQNYKARLRLFFKIHRKPIPNVLTLKRYTGKYGKKAFFTEYDRYMILETLYELYQEGKITSKDYYRVLAGIIAQHELMCRLEGLETFRYTIQKYRYQYNGEEKVVEAIITTTMEKMKRGSEEKKPWDRPMKRFWFTLVKDHLPFPKGYRSSYDRILRMVYLRIIKKLRLFTEEKFYDMSEEEIIEYVRNLELPISNGKRKTTILQKWYYFAEKYVKDPKWEYSLKMPSHIWRHTGIHAWGDEVGRDLGFINAMTHEDPGIYVQIYGALPIEKVIAIVYKLPIQKKLHDFLYGDLLRKAIEKGYLGSNKEQLLKLAKEDGLLD